MSVVLKILNCQNVSLHIHDHFMREKTKFTVFSKLMSFNSGGGGGGRGGVRFRPAAGGV